MIKSLLFDWVKKLTFLGKQTDIVETTMDIKEYRHPDPQSLMSIFDLPGSGTSSHPAKTYFDDKGLAVFDLTIIVTGPSFLKDDLMLAKEVRTLGSPFAVDYEGQHLFAACQAAKTFLLCSISYGRDLKPAGGAQANQ